MRQDGSGFFGVGLNMAWYDKKRKLDSYDEWLAHAAANKVNFIRVWMPDWAFALEGTTRDANEAVTGYVLGDYTLRLDRAAELDAVIAKAKAHGMVVMLTIQNHGPFSFIADSRWGENPYNKANGGPLAKPHDFYTDPVARDLFKRRLRYIVARWGYETNIIWELWNEVDLADRDPFADVVRWHAEMGDYLKAIDPIKHIVTTSLGGGLDDWTRPDPQWTALWQLPQIEVIQVHPYGEGGKRPVDFAHTITSQLQSMTKLNKPILVSETGINWHGPDETLQDDPDWQGLHEAIWAGAFGGGASSGMPWFWDLLIGKYERYDLFVALGVLTDGIAMDAEHFAFDGATATSNTRKLQALPLRGRNHTLVWVRNGPSWWFKPDPTVISDGQLSLGQLANGTYRVRAIATKDGTVTDLGTRTVEVGQTTIDLPPFSTDIAIRLDRRS